jgi:hypothetical protein
MNLSWTQFAKKNRFENNVTVLYQRAKNETPMFFEEPKNNQTILLVKFLHVGLPNIKKGNLTSNKKQIDKTFHLTKYANATNLLKAIYSSSLGIPRRVIMSSNYNSFPLELSLSATATGTRYPISNFLKDFDFGGQLIGGQTINVDWGLLGYWVNEIGLSYTLNTPSIKERGEIDFLTSINKAIMEIVKDCGMEFSQGITITVGDNNPKTFTNIVGVNKQQGSVKADIVFVQKDGDILKDVAWFSHKEGHKATHFQQWGGVSHFLNDKDETLDVFPEIRKFGDYMKQICGRGGLYDFTTSAGKGFTAMMDIENKALKMQSVYGKDFSAGSNFGKSNCTGVLQGDASIVKNGTHKYKLRMSAHAHINPYEMADAYEPVLMIIYKGDRNDLGITGARVVVQPRESRTAKFIVSKDQKGNYEMKPV